jgi:hypothetical protein
MPGYCVISRNEEGKNKQSRYHTWHIVHAPHLWLFPRIEQGLQQKLIHFTGGSSDDQGERLYRDLDLSIYVEMLLKAPCMLVSGQLCHI